MPYIVEFPNEWYLRQSERSAVPTGDIERATTFATEADAQQALAKAKAKKFLKPTAVKAAKIIERN